MVRNAVGEKALELVVVFLGNLDTGAGGVVQGVKQQ
jgi:hypothetical protein